MQQTAWLHRWHVLSGEEKTSSSCLTTESRWLWAALVVLHERGQRASTVIWVFIQNKGCPPPPPLKSTLVSRLVYFCIKQALKLKWLARWFFDRPTYWPCIFKKNSWQLAVKQSKSIFEKCSLIMMAHWGLFNMMITSKGCQSYLQRSEINSCPVPE